MQRISAGHAGAALLIVLVLALGGCTHANAPKPTNHLYSEQKLVQSVDHWRLLARDLADQLASYLDASPTATGGASGPHLALPTPGAAPFEQAFATFLAERLTERGLVLVTDGRGQVGAQTSTQLVAHPSFPVATPARFDVHGRYHAMVDHEVVVRLDLTKGPLLLRTFSAVAYVRPEEAVQFKAAMAPVPKTTTKTYGLAQLDQGE